MRFWQLDVSKCIAVILMVAYNYYFALKYFHVFSFSNFAIDMILPRIAAGMFIFLGGISFAISYNRSSNLAKHAKRAAKFFFLALLISLATVFFTQAPVLFGILHFFAVAVVLSLASIKLERFLLPIGLALTLIGLIIELDFNPFFWLVPARFTTLDYFPLVPWYGIFILGIYFGKKYIVKRKPKSGPKLSNWLQLIGRNSLIVYIAHIPILLFLLYASGVRII